MTRPVADVERVAALLDQGISQAEAARRTGVPQRTVNKWARAGIEGVAARREAAEQGCDPCSHIPALDEVAYAYLLGLYLGDGCIAAYPRNVFRLHITCCDEYPGIIQECAKAMAAVLPNRVGRIRRKGCVDVVSYSKHWPCLFPQHGAGRKHRRRIVLEPWQRRIAIGNHPHLLLRGLVHSDGYRGINRVPRGYASPRYSFSNRSDDIRNIFIETCRRIGVDCRPSNKWNVSVSRQADVAYLDTFIGEKY